jgi:hypothetical protein
MLLCCRCLIGGKAALAPEKKTGLESTERALLYAISELGGLQGINPNQGNVTYKGKCYHQVIGTSVGTSCAVIFANVFLHMLERNIMTSALEAERILIFRRLIDNIFIVLPKTDTENGQRFAEEYNSLHDNINVTHESGKTVEFLDLKIRQPNQTGYDFPAELAIHNRPRRLRRPPTLHQSSIIDTATCHGTVITLEEQSVDTLKLSLSEPYETLAQQRSSTIMRQSLPKDFESGNDVRSRTSGARSENPQPKLDVEQNLRTRAAARGRRNPALALDVPEGLEVAHGLIGDVTEMVREEARNTRGRNKVTVLHRIGP